MKKPNLHISGIQFKDFQNHLNNGTDLYSVIYWIFDEIDLTDIIKTYYSADTIYNEEELESALKAVKDNK